MKIIREPKPVPTFERQIECPTCDALLLVHESDLSIMPAGPNETMCYFKCPACTNTVSVDKFITPRQLERVARAIAGGRQA